MNEILNNDLPLEPVIAKDKAQELEQIAQKYIRAI